MKQNVRHAFVVIAALAVAIGLALGTASGAPSGPADAMTPWRCAFMNARRSARVIGP